ncbi:putative glutathione synthase [Kockovaella imperatae]|uniref:Glutathione synthetase n=1 Tax=Kockovaella imperatae TaxID=4999 RepID=A0A1Y1UB91_9TREE|nr:putative glutathione synthase [Kockovaella imperatae]ORX35272.1 putative glutathione synthase [Kockovaella imperatae]
MPARHPGRSPSPVPPTLPTWPPQVSQEQHDHLLNLGTTFALSHGFTLLPPDSTTPPTHTFSAPLSLFPTPFPRGLYEWAKDLQPLYNGLYARIAMDWEFLDRVMGGVAKVDSFQGELWRGWKSCREDLVQPLQLGVFRSDYLLHQTSGAGPLELKQVEFNTIASSFGALSQRAGEMHRYLCKTTNYFSASSYLSLPNMPHNLSLRDIAAGLADAWKAYGREDAQILFVVQAGERNVFDQRWLEYELLERHGIKTIRHTFEHLEDLAQIDRTTKRLLLPSQLEPSAAPTEIAVIYYRSAYTPVDYPSHAEWTTRVLLERSKAIKCPSMALQLAGAKKIQQVLTEPGVLESFLFGPERPDVGWGKGAGNIGQRAADELRKTWIGLWPLDQSMLGREALEMALNQPERFVMKPQREGGGNNIYRNDIPPALAALDDQPRKSGEADKKEGYILMELITPPQGVSNWLLKGGESKARKADVVSELGVYGVMLFVDDQGREVNESGVEAVNKAAGTLLRTKGRESDEGGVAIGISSIDSPLLI